MRFDGSPRLLRTAATTPTEFSTAVPNFDGIGYQTVVPPDTNGAVGRDHFVQSVNSNTGGTQFAVYAKTGGPALAGPLSLAGLDRGRGRQPLPGRPRRSDRRLRPVRRPLRRVAVRRRPGRRLRRYGQLGVHRRRPGAEPRHRRVVPVRVPDGVRARLPEARRLAGRVLPELPEGISRGHAGRGCLRSRETC